jgi:DHA2 family multidrug resistance protein
MAEPAAPNHASWRPKHNPWLIAFSVLLATFMEVLDTSIANVSLPHIAGNLSVTTEESTWILTSYLVSNAIILSGAGWLSRYFGRKNYLAFSVILFTVSSALCGIATSLPFLIIARVFQGLGGGGLQPLSQAILLESFPPQDRGKAMAAYGMGIVVAPIIGPILGGWITDNFSWRWIFLINIPIGLLGLVMQHMFVEDPPYLKGDKPKIDYVGFGFMAVGIGVLQIILDKGQQSDWFGAEWIRWSTLLVAVSLIAFVIWELRSKEPIVNLRLLKDRNFATATLLMAATGAVMYGSTVILPIFMQLLLGYPAFNAGLAMMPRGIGSFISMLIVGRVIGKLDGRFMIFGGFTTIALSSWMLSRLNLDISTASIMWPLVINGFAMGFVFVPMTTYSVSTLKQEQIYQSASLYGLMRNMGASIGISIIVALQSRWEQVHQVTLAGRLTAENGLLRDQLQSTAAGLAAHGFTGALPAQGAAHLMYQTLQRQATLLSFMDCFMLMAILCVLCLPLVLLFRKGHKPAGPVMAE